MYRRTKSLNTLLSGPQAVRTPGCKDPWLSGPPAVRTLGCQESLGFALEVALEVRWSRPPSQKQRFLKKARMHKPEICAGFVELQIRWTDFESDFDDLDADFDDSDV